MRTIIFILQKEFIQIFRNKMMIPIIFGVPIIQLFILAYAATFEMKNIRAFIVDLDRSVASRELVSKFRGSPFYTITGFDFNYTQAERSIETGQADLIIEIPSNFERNLQVDKKAQIGLVANAINSTTANLAYAYTSAIIKDYNIDLVTKMIGKKVKQPIQVRYSYWFNPELDYKTYMVPGILVLLVTMIGLFLASMNVVREKEIGTIEQINVTPIKKYQFIAGKLIPFWIIAIFELAFGLLVAKLFFNIPIVGSLWLIFGVAAVYMIAILGLGLIISAISDTMQQAMFVAWFFMVVFILMSGLFTSVESMPHWARMFNIINPIAYFIEIIRMIMLKGSGFKDIFNPFMALMVYSVLALWIAVWRYRKVA
ncbi:MAG: ABC transporter permease [Bacteroidetes bacterium 4572_114]|nr:MAG: ABC transporter permease [Bacteroidetes bacterium 4572_114]